MPIEIEQILLERANLYKRIRSFFDARGVIEVDVPVLGCRTVSDVYLEPLTTDVCGQQRFLQTSPEYFMKRLLAQGVGSIYYLGKAFRADEVGARHSPEFAMLEWYMLGFDDQTLIRQITDLLLELSPGLNCSVVAYESCFQSAFGCSAHSATLLQLQDLVAKHTTYHGMLTSRSECLDLLFSVCIEPTLVSGAYFVYDFPAEQAALARLDENEHGQRVAKRFELYWNGLELANGYWELTDPQEQCERFQRDLHERRLTGKPVPQLDEAFLKALDSGLPDCAGVALGVDRLLMSLLGVDNISSVMAFNDY